MNAGVSIRRRLIFLRVIVPVAFVAGGAVARDSYVGSYTLMLVVPGICLLTLYRAKCPRCGRPVLRRTLPRWRVIYWGLRVPRKCEQCGLSFVESHSTSPLR